MRHTKTLYRLCRYIHCSLFLQHTMSCFPTKTQFQLGCWFIFISRLVFVIRLVFQCTKPKFQPSVYENKCNSLCITYCIRYTKRERDNSRFNNDIMNNSSAYAMTAINVTGSQAPLFLILILILIPFRIQFTQMHCVHFFSIHFHFVHKFRAKYLILIFYRTKGYFLHGFKCIPCRWRVSKMKKTKTIIRTAYRITCHSFNKIIDGRSRIAPFFRRIKRKMYVKIFFLPNRNVKIIIKEATKTFVSNWRVVNRISFFTVMLLDFMWAICQYTRIN